MEPAEILVKVLSRKLARSLSTPPDDINSSKPLFDYGVDSLVSAEIRNWIGKEFKADVAVFDIMGGATIRGAGTLVSLKRSIEELA